MEAETVSTLRSVFIVVGGAFEQLLALLTVPLGLLPSLRKICVVESWPGLRKRYGSIVSTWCKEEVVESAFDEKNSESESV
jgi:hypothetical protein